MPECIILGMYGQIFSRALPLFWSWLPNAVRSAIMTPSYQAPAGKGIHGGRKLLNELKGQRRIQT